MRVLVSACLLGENCKYNGGNNKNEPVLRFLAEHEIVPVCPELLSGLGVPRAPVELVNGRAVTRAGTDVDAMFRAGVQLAMERIRGERIDLVILQSRSPSCGVRQVYDGSFSGRLVDGQGLFAQALAEAGYRVTDAAEYAQF